MYRDATETGGVGFSAGAVEYGWCPSPSPLPPSSPALRARKGELASGTTPWPPVRCHQGRGGGSLPPALPPGPPVRCHQRRGRGSLSPELPPGPRPLPPEARKGELVSGTTPWPPVRCHQGRGRGGRRESMLALPHAMTARVQYVPNKKFGFLIAR